MKNRNFKGQTCALKAKKLKNFQKYHKADPSHNKKCIDLLFFDFSIFFNFWAFITHFGL